MIKLYDDYDLSMELIATCSTTEEMEIEAKKRYIDTDEECVLYYQVDNGEKIFIPTI